MSWGDQTPASRSPSRIPGLSAARLRSLMQGFPVLSFLFVASILGWGATMLWTSVVYSPAFHTLTFVPFLSDGEHARFVPFEIMLASGELWRLLTPIFLHFSLLHLVFNLLIAFEFGRRSEAVLGSVRFGFLVLGLALISNLAQFLVVPTPLFGGLSGVNYGLVGFVAVRRVRDPFEYRWQVPPALILFLVISMVLFSFGIGEAFGLQVANAAHWGGFLTGLISASIIAPRAKAS